MINKNKDTLTLESKVKFIDRADNGFEKSLDGQTIEGVLKQMSITTDREDILVREGFFQDLDALGKVEVILSAIRSGLCGLHEYDDIVYIVKDNEVHFDRIRVK